MADEQLVQAMVDAMLSARFAGWKRMVAGYKNADGSITMAGAGVGRVWARSPEDSRGGTAVWGSAAYANAPLVVGPGFDGEYEVKGADWLTASISFGEGARVIDQPPGMSELVPDSIPPRSIKIGRVEVASGLNFRVSPFAYPGGSWESDAAQSVSSFVPGTANEVCWVKPYLDPDTNTISAVASTPVFGEPQDLDEADIASITLPAGAIPLGPAFTLRNGQTQLSASRFADTDPRIFLSSHDNSGGGAFTDLSDVPSSYSGEAGKYVQVNATEDGLQFAPSASGGAGDYILFRDEKTQNTAGGGFSSGAWQTRDLTVESADPGGHASLSSNQITLAAGTYRVRISCPAFNVTSHQARLQDITNTATLIVGTTEYAEGANATTRDATRSFIDGRITLAGSTVLEVQHRCTVTKTTNGFGVPANLSTEVYTVAEFIRE